MRAIRWFVLFCLLTAACAIPASANEADIRATLRAYVEAFNKHDAATVAAMWSENATHTDRETGERTEGRAAIQADIEEAFKVRPDARLAGTVDRVRLIKPDVANVDGQTRIGAGDDDPAVSAFTAILINQSGKWLIDSMEEMPMPTLARPADALSDLTWLIGSWVDEGEGARVETTIRWTADKAFLLRSFRSENAEGELQQGTQVIGWDPRAEQIRSWSFNSDGSFGDGVWSRSNGDWLIKSSQTMADGQAASGTYVLKQVDENTITLELIGHEIEGEPQPARPAVKVVRVPEATPATTTPKKTP